MKAFHKRIFIYTLLFCLCISSSSLLAQQDIVMYNMKFVHTRLNLNPALRPQARLNIAFPGLGSTNVSFTNSGFAYADIIRKRADDSLVVDLDRMLGKLKKNNYLGLNLNLQLLDIGFKAGRMYFRVHAQERIAGRMNYTKDFMQLLIKGNGATLGQEQKLNLGLDFMHYREYGLGFSYEISDQWTAGITLKYLYGMENINTAKSDVFFTTDPNNFALSGRSDIKINSTGFDSTETSFSTNAGKYLFGKKNTGFAADLGVVYKPTERWEFAASLLDMGSINWKEQNHVYYSANPNKPFSYGGISVNDFLNDSTNINDAVKQVADSLKETFDVKDSKNGSAYKTKLNRQFYLSANYYVGEKTTVGALLHGQFYDKKLYPSFGVSAATGIGRLVNVSASYSIMNQSYANLGVGLAINLGPLQWHIMTDNLLAVVKPLETRNVHVRTGFYYTFKRHASDRDEDGITDFKDRCPDEPGLPQFSGCPDSDNDGIENDLDSCPYEAGLPYWNGCPDSDNDSIIDKLDSCASDSGLKEFNGCPDTDRDGIMNKLDSCPADSGLAKFNGCPDRDADGIMDKEDACPDKAGPLKFKGCPDTDKDGIMDKEDECPDQAGPAKFNGCPDRDGDGIMDKKDDCPDTAGVARFNGCPDTDSDGISDKFDPCPTVPGPAYAMGCPDSDGDSLPDALDLCPQEFGSRKLNGCPDADTDGIADKDDKCPTTPGVPANYGCPELKQEEQEIINAAFDNLEFATGKDIIKPESYTSLNNLANLMKQKSNWKLQLDGHTDNQGVAKKNLLLSQKRADAVKRYLVSKGIAATRLTAKGYGSSRPVADNSTPEGRDRNRRVEMTIIY